LLFVLACQTLLRPVNQAQDLARTAEALSTQAIQMATQAQALPTTAANPTEAIPGAQPTQVPVGTPGPGNIFDPQGAPLSSWKDIPVMPQAVAGEEAEGMYSFRVNASIKEVQDYYTAQLPPLGWQLLFSGDMPILVFTRNGQTLSVTISEQSNGTVVLLALE
jgi:hypothetical protein